MPKVDRQKVCMLLYPNSKMGGILTVHNNMLHGFAAAGYETIDYYLSPSSRPCVPSADTKNCKSVYCSGRALPLMEAQIQQTVEVLKHHDVFVFSTPCPSKTSSFTDTGWLVLLRKLRALNKTILVFWHDPFWEEYYPWLSEAFDLIDGVLCVQQKAYDNVPEQLQDRRVITNHPMRLDQAVTSKYKEDLVISPHQFKSWKKIEVLIQACPDILSTDVAVEVFNTGIEYYYMSGSLEKRKEKYKKNGRWIWDDAVAAGMQYRGMVTEEELRMAFLRHKVCVDMSVGELGTRKADTYRSLNYSVLESLYYYGAPIVRKFSLLPPFSEDSLFVVPEGDLVSGVVEKTKQVIEDWKSKEIQSVIRCGREILLDENASCQIAKKIAKKFF